MIFKKLKILIEITDFYLKKSIDLNCDLNQPTLPLSATLLRSRTQLWRASWVENWVSPKQVLRRRFFMITFQDKFLLNIFSK